MSQIKGELKTDESNSESNNEFDKYQNYVMVYIL